ncbi:head GIN domain-containing protein [Erythrobacter sp. NE805]|uniref:head GIN domain-containing protein n=1 Tax=Erythrobacter sp. NE805 TaxID=3389875 RepID=UPI00396B24D6
MIRPDLRRLAPGTLAALTLMLGGCLDGDVEINGEKGVPLSEVEIAGPPPTDVILGSGDTVVVTEGNTFSLKVEGADTDSLRFVRDKEVIAVSREKGWTGESSAVIRVTMPAPKQIVIGGSGTVKTPALASTAAINIGGSGTVEFGKVAAEKLEINIGGSGTVQGAGTAKALEVLIGGSGKIVMPQLKADKAEVSIGGSGDVAFASDGTVEANIGGAGDVKVTGTAKCTVNAFGSGTLTCSPAGATGTIAPPAQ